MLHITLLQPNLYWHDPVANRAMLEERIFNLPEPTDLIVLPEMFTTGFTMDAKSVAEPHYVSMAQANGGTDRSGCNGQLRSERER